MSLTPQLAELQQKIEKIAKDYGLDFFDTIFELVDYDQINSLAAMGGFPTRYPHWRFGMEYDRFSKSYEYGMSKIYEMVINNDPSYAYLVNSNDLMNQKLVMCHVYGHVDFFKNNYWFSKTDRKMVDTMANHATRIRRYIDQLGLDVVEDFIDVCLSIDNLIDPYLPFTPQKSKSTLDAESDDEKGEVKKMKTDRSYMDKYINPEEFVKGQEEKVKKAKEEKKRHPREPQRDVLKFLLENSPLEEWQADVLSMIRDEAYYYVPQAMTKIMNEGWASYWHSKLMTEKVLDGNEVLDYADVCSGVFVTQPGQLNPYKLGVELFRDIEERWNKGQFGKEWEECESIEEKKNWDRNTGQGKEKIFEVRKIYNDVTFIDEFFTEEFCERTNYYKYLFNSHSGRYEISSRDFQQVKEQMLASLTNMGQPVISVVDSNYANRAELLLEHRHQGMDLDLNYAKETLKNVCKIWSRPVNLRTKVEGQVKIFTHNGSDFKMEDFSKKPAKNGKE
jgi:stage V sporulation protein R